MGNDRYVEKENPQDSLFDVEDAPTPHQEEWKDMPEMVQNDIEPYREIAVKFSCQEDVDAFLKLVDQEINSKTKKIWFPKWEMGNRTKVYR